MQLTLCKWENPCFLCLHSSPTNSEILLGACQKIRAPIWGYSRFCSSKQRWHQELFRQLPSWTRERPPTPPPNPTPPPKPPSNHPTPPQPKNPNQPPTQPPNPTPPNQPTAAHPPPNPNVSSWGPLISLSLSKPSCLPFGLPVFGPLFKQAPTVGNGRHTRPCPRCTDSWPTQVALFIKRGWISHFQIARRIRPRFGRSNLPPKGNRESAIKATSPRGGGGSANDSWYHRKL